ncbi:nitroimidazol reductase NimA-like FMN-containing flavoprotein (pyridoxamine 5'-phosphate oxidase superfamily) [Bradyrhizobium sp. LB9.1b]
MSQTESQNSYPTSARNQVKRRHDRGFYDHDTVHRILDSAMLCHVSYAIDGQPYCTPTFFWRERTKLYWHGSSASRMLRNQTKGERVCLTVAHLDSLVLARCGFNHSADYRAVMAFGTAYLVTDPEEKERAVIAHGRPLLPGSHRKPAGDQYAGDQGDLLHRDGDRGSLRESPCQGCRRR